MFDEHFRPDGFGIMPFIHVWGIQIPAYTFFMVLALLAGVVTFKLTREKLDRQKSEYRVLIVLTALLGGIIGAKLPIVIANFNLLFKYPENISLLLSGRTIVGGLIGGFLSVLLLKKALHINLKTGNDIAAPVALAMAVGRLGCFFGGCCYGIPSPAFLGVNFGDGIPRYPTQLYELVFDLGMFFVFLYLKKTKPLKPGILFFYLLNSYLIFRFFIEFIRVTDKAFWIISWYQIICIVCLAVINLRHLKARKDEIHEPF